MLVLIGFDTSPQDISQAQTIQQTTTQTQEKPQPTEQTKMVEDKSPVQPSQNAENSESSVVIEYKVGDTGLHILKMCGYSS